MDIKSILRQTPQTSFVTISRRGTALLNMLCLKAQYGDQRPVMTIPGDYETNMNNYDFHGSLVDSQPCPVPVFIGMRVTLTKNLMKQWNFVNGMGATVTDVGEKGIQVKTDVDNLLWIYPYTDDDICIHGEWRRAVYFPLRLGYSTTLMKVQGATLDHMTFWYDVTRIVPAAIYVAISRVRHDADWKFFGKILNMHCRPADGC
eukprot:12431484-Karenia_brevis.AAC.4